MTDRDETHRHVLEAARPLGSGTQSADAALFAEIDARIADGRAADAIGAARQLVAEGRVATGGGTAENVAQRLARRYRERIISRGVGESATVGPMKTHTAPPDPEIAAIVAGLVARIAALEARDAARETRVAALTSRAMEADLIIARLIEHRGELVQEVGELRDAARDYAERLGGITDTVERYVGTAELRLQALGTQRIRSLREH